MNSYRLKISLVEPHYPINELHRIVEVSGNIRFDELHQEICHLFHRRDEHLWQFFISRTKMDSFNKLFKECHEHVLSPTSEQLKDEVFLANNKHYPTSTTLDELHLSEKDYLYCWFDLGDEWLHRIRIEKITEDKISIDGYVFRVIKEVGQIPLQYDDEVFDVDESEVALPPHPDAISPELDLELSLLSAMMLIAADINEPVRFGDLVETGVADELIHRGLIKPCLSLTHRVKLTAKGESELARFIDLLDL